MTISNIEAHNQYIEQASNLLASMAEMLSSAAEVEIADASGGTIQIADGKLVTTTGPDPFDEEEYVSVSCFTIGSLAQFAKSLGEISRYISLMQAVEAQNVTA